MLFVLVVSAAAVLVVVVMWLVRLVSMVVV